MAADLAENLRTLFLSTDAIKQRIGRRMHQDKVPQNERRPYIYYGRQNVRLERALDDDPGEAPFSHTFALECVGDTPRETSQLVDAVRTLDLHTGAFGDSTVQLISIDDQSDDYDPVNAGGDRGRHVAALSVEVVP